MFRAIILPVFRNTRLCVTACGIMHPRCCRPVAQRATHTHNRLEYAAITLATKHINKYAGTIPVILARHWLPLPDDGSYVNRNMSEQIFYF